MSAQTIVDQTRGGENPMLSTMNARIRGLPLCGLCSGTGQDPQVPTRQTSGGELMFLVRPCPACEGRGVEAKRGDRNLAPTTV